jgi:hypothetical protein
MHTYVQIIHTYIGIIHTYIHRNTFSPIQHGICQIDKFFAWVCFEFFMFITILIQIEVSYCWMYALWSLFCVCLALPRCAEPRSLMLPKSVVVLQCYLGWRTLLKCNKTNHSCLPACLPAWATIRVKISHQGLYQHSSSFWYCWLPLLTALTSTDPNLSKSCLSLCSVCVAYAQ